MWLLDSLVTTTSLSHFWQSHHWYGYLIYLCVVTCLSLIFKWLKWDTFHVLYKRVFYNHLDIQEIIFTIVFTFTIIFTMTFVITPLDVVTCLAWSLHGSSETPFTSGTREYFTIISTYKRVFSHSREYFHNRCWQSSPRYCQSHQHLLHITIGNYACLNLSCTWIKSRHLLAYLHRGKPKWLSNQTRRYMNIHPRGER